MGLFRGAVFRHGGGALKQPIKQPTETPTSTLALMGRFPSLMGRFPTLMGRFTDFVLRVRFTSWKSTGKQPIKKRGIKRFLNNFRPNGASKNRREFEMYLFPLRCCHRTTARKTPATSHGVGSWRGIDQELTNFWATLCVQNLALAISCCFSPTKSAYKIRLARSWPRVGQRFGSAIWAAWDSDLGEFLAIWAPRFQITSDLRFVIWST